MGVAGAADGMIDAPTTMAGTTEATNREIITMWVAGGTLVTSIKGTMAAIAIRVMARS